MPARLVIDKSANKDFLKLPKNIQKKAISAYQKLSTNPIIGVRLSGQLHDYYKLRLGDYRIVYKFHIKIKVVEVIKIEHRQGVYK